ncbi:MAG: hypothetical protein ACE5O2_07460, partial [Armatimonadota bacterium]
PDADYMYIKRVMAWHKPYMFLMNTRYDDFPPPMVERYMQRCLFYGMFPGFFSHNASSDPYFGNPAWYNRDRHLFVKYMPIIRRVAEAGWEPITLATSDDDDVWVERFGRDMSEGVYFTVMNLGDAEKAASITIQGPEGATRAPFVEAISGRQLGRGPALKVSLAPDQVVVLQVGGETSR